MNYRAAIDLAVILSKLGEHERADWLLDGSHGPGQDYHEKDKIGGR